MSNEELKNGNCGCGCGCDDEVKEVKAEESCGCGCGCDDEVKEDASKESCGCGCGDHDHEDERNTITLTLEDDEEVVCDVLGVFDVEDQEYIAVLPENGDDAYIYRYAEVAEDEIQLDNIENEDEFNKVSEAFMQLVEEE